MGSNDTAGITDTQGLFFYNLSPLPPIMVPFLSRPCNSRKPIRSAISERMENPAQILDIQSKASFGHLLICAGVSASKKYLFVQYLAMSCLLYVPQAWAAAPIDRIS